MIVNDVKLEAARSSFLALGQEVFATQKNGMHMAYTRVVPCDAEYLEVDALGPNPAVVEQIGNRRWGSVRAYAVRGRVRRYGPDGLEYSILKIKNDKTGLIQQEIAAYGAALSNFYEKPVTDFLISNPTCLDGGALLSTTHSFGSAGGTWSNRGSAALSPSEFATGISTMEGLLFENGEPANYYPNVLMVGPSNRKLAMDLCKAPMRVVPVSASGVEAYASAVAATAVNNWIFGEITVIVNPRLVGSCAAYWFLFDTRREVAKPIILGEAIAPQAYAVTDGNSQGMVDRSVARFYAEAWFALVGGAPYSVYGYVG